jgi:uncharacterized protein YndB with AHSA1/START domain
MPVNVPKSKPYVAQAFGLRWRSDCPIPWFGQAPDDGRAIDVEIERSLTLEPRPGGRRVNNGEIFPDGTRFMFEGAVIDMVDGHRISWFAPELDKVPLAVSSTVAAHLLAWRGFVPLHGSAVEIDGVAILVCGRSGAGKSTLASALVERGGALVSDDLSVMMPVGPGEQPMLLPGRPTIRLAARLGDGREKPKQLAPAPLADPDRPVSLALMLLLQDKEIGGSPAGPASAMLGQLFRPTWMRVLPNIEPRTASLLAASQRIAIATLPPAPNARDVTPAERAEQALALLRSHSAAALPRSAPAP